MTILTFIIYLCMAAACAWIASMLVPGNVPGGFFTSAIFGVIGAWIGGSLIGPVGPSVAGLSLLPAILGSALLVFLVHLIARGGRAHV